MNRHVKTALLFGFGFIATLHAEDSQRRINERISVETKVFPYSKLKDPLNGTPHEHLEIQPENVRVRLGLPPVFFHEKTGMLLPSVSYEQLHFNYRNWDSSYEPYRVDTLHSLSANVFYRQPLSKPKWGYGWFVSTSLSSDFKVLNAKSLRLQGGGFFSRKVTGGSFSFGLALLDSYGRPRLFPAIGFDPTPEARHKFTLRIPVETSYYYCPHWRWEAGAAVRVTGINAELTETGAYNRRSVAYSVGTVGPSVHYKFTKNLSLAVDGGWAPYHRFQILDKKEKLRDYDLTTPYFVATSLKFSL